MVKRLTSPCPILDGLTVISSPLEGEALAGESNKKNRIAKGTRIPLITEGKLLSLISLFHQGVDSTPGKDGLDLIASLHLCGVLNDIHLRHLSGDTVTSL